MRVLIAATLAVFGVVALSTTGTAYAAEPQAKQAEAPHIVTVQPGDSLTKIADTEQSTVERIYSANDAIVNPDLIYPDQQLRIPSATENLTMRAMPAAAAPVAATPATESAAAAPAVAPRTVARTAAPVVAGGSVWDSLAQCESGGNWAINTGNGFYGGLQFTISSWQAMGGSGLPSQASREEQIMRAQSLQAVQGWGAWPACSAKLGLL